MTVLVTGGSGLVGQHLKKILPDIVYLSSSDADLRRESEVNRIYSIYNPSCVIHLAARVGGISDNIAYPSTYMEDNILMNTLVLRGAIDNGVDRFIGMLSTCIYPDVVEEYPMREEMLHLGPPTPTNFSYAYAKRTLAVQIDAVNKQYGSKYNYLIPCNLYGSGDKEGADSHFVTALLKKINDANIAGAESISLYGTGNPMRQFMHAGDLAWVIKYCLDNDVRENFNVATDENYTIKRIAEIALEATGSTHLSLEFDPEKPDGQYRKDVSIDRLMKFIPEFSATKLFDGIKETYDWNYNV